VDVVEFTHELNNVDHAYFAFGSLRHPACIPGDRDDLRGRRGGRLLGRGRPEWRNESGRWYR
jgi:hypothetical protein